MSESSRGATCMHRDEATSELCGKPAVGAVPKLFSFEALSDESTELHYCEEHRQVMLHGRVSEEA
jgi:hypothetical protein